MFDDMIMTNKNAHIVRASGSLRHNLVVEQRNTWRSQWDECHSKALCPTRCNSSSESQKNAGREKGNEPCRWSGTSPSDALIPLHWLHRAHQSCYPKQGKEPWRVPRWREEHQAQPSTQGNAQSQQSRQGRQYHRLQGSNHARDVELDKFIDTQ